MADITGSPTFVAPGTLPEEEETARKKLAAEDAGLPENASWDEIAEHQVKHKHKKGRGRRASIIGGMGFSPRQNTPTPRATPRAELRDVARADPRGSRDSGIPAELAGHRGWLWKQGKNVGGTHMEATRGEFKERWFEMSAAAGTLADGRQAPRNLAYYDATTTPGKLELKGVITLHHGKYALSIPKSQRKGFQHVFRLDMIGAKGVATRTKYILAANCGEDLVGWMTALGPASGIQGKEVSLSLVGPAVRRKPLGMALTRRAQGLTLTETPKAGTASVTGGVLKEGMLLQSIKTDWLGMERSLKSESAKAALSIIEEAMTEGDCTVKFIEPMSHEAPSLLRKWLSKDSAKIAPDRPSQTPTRPKQITPHQAAMGRNSGGGGTSPRSRPDERAGSLRRRRSISVTMSSLESFVSPRKMLETLAERKSEPAKVDLCAMVEVQGVVAASLDRARREEVRVTGCLQEIAKDLRGQLHGLEFRIKTHASLVQKVLRKWSADGKQSIADVIAIVDEQGDTLRYTIVFGTEDYTSAVKTALERLCKHGYMPFRFKNYWKRPAAGRETDYMGINSTFASHQECRFEVQFHTTESLETKQTVHVSYENFRAESNEGRRAQYWEEMARLWSLVPVPTGAVELGATTVKKYSPPVMVTGPQPDAWAEPALHARFEEMRALSADVRDRCCSALVSVISAEPHVTERIQRVNKRCGGKLHGLEFRVKSPNSMTRRVLIFQTIWMIV